MKDDTTYKSMVPYYKVAFLGESIACSGFPKKTFYDNDEFKNDSYELNNNISEKGVSRAIKLAQMADGSGHKNFLKGICVYLNVVATQVWWLQAMRYSHFVPVSSFSKMHSLRGLLKNNVGTPDVDKRIIDILNEKANDETVNDEVLASNCPMGLQLTCGVVTNYAQLRTIWVQRRFHKKVEWRNFCDWIETLPYSKEFICYEKQ